MRSTQSQDDDGWAYLGRIGAVISNQASFDPRNYGYKKLGDLIRAVDLFETQVMDNNQMSVRDKRRGKPYSEWWPLAAQVRLTAIYL